MQVSLWKKTGTGIISTSSSTSKVSCASIRYANKFKVASISDLFISVNLVEMKLQQLQVALTVLGLVSSVTLQPEKRDLGTHAAMNVSLRNEITLHDALKAIENFIDAEESSNARQAGNCYIVSSVVSG